MSFKIYTKTGDEGQSSLYNGSRRPKDDKLFDALGDVDELNSAVGLAREYAAEVDESLSEQLETIQSRLLDVGSAIATPIPASSDRKLAKVKFDEQATSKLEAWIDSMDESLEPLTKFILPSGGKGSAHLHVARTICRRAERRVTTLAGEDQVEREVSIFLNRLSDYFFTAARFVAMKTGHIEKTYRKNVGLSE
ncbi:hypothetical protein BSKO_00661 [Bryopsis sp. KO-2023]|nr:hypothetical protein BSKO_00661 [Bryopsis sp. KO-2023]